MDDLTKICDELEQCRKNDHVIQIGSCVQKQNCKDILGKILTS